MIISDLNYLESMPEASSIVGGNYFERTSTTTVMTSSSEGDKKLTKEEAKDLAEKLESLSEIFESSGLFESFSKLF